MLAGGRSSNRSGPRFPSQLHLDTRRAAQPSTPLRQALNEFYCLSFALST